MNTLLLILILITPFAYIVSSYAFVLILLISALLFVRDVNESGNRFVLLFLLAILFSCISIGGIRLYDLVTVIAFIATFIRKRGHLSVIYRSFPFFIMVILVGITHSGIENLTETVRYIICLLLFITAFNNKYDFEKIKRKILLLSIANIYFAIIVFVLNSMGRISQYSGLISSNIFVLTSTSETRLSGFFSDPNKYMTFCLMLLFIVELWIEKSKEKNTLLIILFISSFISLSRTAILSLLTYLLFKVIKYTYENHKILSISLVALIITFIAIFALYPNLLNVLANSLYVTSARLMGREHTLTINANLQSDNRTKIWRKALNLIEQQPILGHGWNSIRDLLPYPTHNTVLELLMDCGIVGLVCYLIFIRKILFNKYYEYTIPFVWVPLLLLDLGGYRVLFLLLGLIYCDTQSYAIEIKKENTGAYI